MSIIKDFNKQLKDLKEWKRTNKPFKNLAFLDKEYISRQEAHLKFLLGRSTETATEKKLWIKYQQAVVRSFKIDNPERKFRMSHVNDLGIDWDIFFLYSKKDIGKTRQLGKFLEDLKLRDPTANVVFIRNNKEEVHGLKETMNNSIHWPTWTDGEHVWWKDQLFDAKGYKKVTTKVKPCGFVAYASGLGFVKWQGSEFDNVKFWLWDECNSIEGGLTFDVFQSVNVFLSSIIRDKRNVKGFMFGNLLEKENIFLSRLGVTSKTRLKVIDIHKDRDPKKELLSRLLYLNTGDLFKGIEEQVGLATQFLDDSEHLSLLHNRPGITDQKSQYEELDLRAYQPLFCFVFDDVSEVVGGRKKVKYFILYAYKVPRSNRIVVWIDLFRPQSIRRGFKLIFTPEELIANEFSMVIYQEKEDITSLFEFLGEMLTLGEVWFGFNGTETVFKRCWVKWRTKYIVKEEDKAI